MRRGEVRGWPDEVPMRAYTMPIEVQGHTDAAEATAGGASLGEARAEAVAAFLQMNGVPADVIEVVAFGAERPLVVASGAEPQNRRAELIAR
jgi:peptidoglycan-associated lipoprotein